MNGLTCETVPEKCLARRNKAHEREVEKNHSLPKSENTEFPFNTRKILLLRLATNPYKEFEFCTS